MVLTGQSVWVVRCYVYFTTLPTVDTYILAVSGSPRAGVLFRVSDSSLYAGTAPSTFGSTGVAVITGRWYRVDVRVNQSANPWVIDAQVDGAACAQMTSATASATPSQLFVGVNLGSSASADVQWDDVIVSHTSGDYPLGPGFVHHFVPTADGTHGISASGDFDRGDTGTDILSSTTDSYLLIDDVPLPSGAVNQADCIRALAPLSTEYTENIFGPAPGIPTPRTAPRFVEAVGVKHALGTASSQLQVNLRDNASDGTVHAFTGNNGTAYGYFRAAFATAPSAAAWNLNASGNGSLPNLRVRFFAQDANPDVCLDAIMLEVEFPHASPPPSPMAVSSPRLRQVYRSSKRRYV